ncbi:MAG: thioredoxin-disulfide reductase [Clostridia bacterium]
MLYDVIIIGGGPAGMTAALYAARSGLQAVLVERGALGGQLMKTDWIDNYPGFPEGIGGMELMNNFALQVERFGVNTHYANVEKLELSGDIKRVLTDDGELEGKTVIIATGSEPKQLGIPGEIEFTGAGVSYCAVCDGMFFRGKKVVVLGGGDTALEEAEYLAKIASEVMLIHRRDAFRGAKILADNVKQNDKIKLLLSTKPLAIEGDKKVTSIRLQNLITNIEFTEACDGVFVLVGTKPNSELLIELTLDAQGYVLTDEELASNIPGVFACGDVRKKPLRQVSTAVGDGAIAAMSASHYVTNTDGRA